MIFSISREVLLKPLQQVAGVVERKQTLPVLSNILIAVDGNQLSITGTDLEIELVARVELEESFPSSEITIQARKLLDICKSLPGGAKIGFEKSEQKITVKSGRSRFSLATLPANEFPNLEKSTESLKFRINQRYLKNLLDGTSFAMAQQDVRFYLNGMLLEVSPNRLRVVTTDGHRLALSDAEVDVSVDEKLQAIIPRKGVMELARLFCDDCDVMLKISENHIRAESDSLTFTSKLIDGKFPDYERVIPKNGDKLVIGDKQEMLQGFSRVAILSNEKYRGVRIKVDQGVLDMEANNPDQEEAEETINVDYHGPVLEIGFNVSYLLEVLNAIGGDTINIKFSDSSSSALIQDADKDDSIFVVMPMRL